MTRWQRRVVHAVALAIPWRYRDDIMADVLDDGGSFTRVLAATLAAARDARRIARMHARQERGDAMRLEAWWHGLGTDLRSAVRHHRAHPGAALTIIAILAVAIGLNVALFSMVRAVLLRPLAFAEPDRVVFVWNTRDTSAREPLAPARALDVRREVPSLQSAALIGHISMTVRGLGPAERWSGASVSSSFFDVVRTPALIGRTFRTGEPDRRVVVLSYAWWQERFHGDPGVVGRTVVMNDVPRLVIGVMPAAFYWPTIAGEVTNFPDPRFWSAAEEHEVPERPVPFAEDVTQNRQMGFLRVVARLADGATPASASADLARLNTRLAAAYPDTDGGRQFSIVDARTQLFGPVERPLWFVWLAGALVLVGASVNIGNLLLVQLSGRQRELDVRSALGAGRWRLVRQLAVEALALAAAGGLAGVGLAVSVLRALVALAPMTVGRLDQARIDLWALGAAVAAAFVTALALTLVGAARVCRDRTADGLRTAGAGAAGRHRLRTWLVGAEVALAAVLLVGAALFGQSLWRLQRVDVGFDTRNLLTFDVLLTGERAEYQAKQLDFFTRFIERVRALPGVRHAAGAVTLPIGGDDFGASIVVDGRPVPPPGQERRLGFQIVGPGWFDTLGMHLVRGRDFLATDTRQSERVVIINRALADLEFRGEDPVGRRVRQGREADAPVLTIVGVVNDIRHLGPAERPRPEIYLPYSQFSLPIMSVAVRTSGDPLALETAVRAAAAEVDATQALSGMSTMARHLNRRYSQARFLSALTLLFGGLAVGLALVGVYGVTSAAVRQRTREFGVRTALGATPAQVAGGVLREAARPVLIGAVAGAAVAAAAAHLISALLFDTAPLEPVSYAAAVVAVAVAALAACAVPARRAASADPLLAIRES